MARPYLPLRTRQALILATLSEPKTLADIRLEVPVSRVWLHKMLTAMVADGRVEKMPARSSKGRHAWAYVGVS